MTPREIALGLAAVTVVADAATARKNELRERLQDALLEAGADSARAELPDGTRVARSSIVAPEPAPIVTDAAAFTAFIVENFPDEVVTTVEIRPAFKKVLLERLTALVDGTPIDTGTGLEVEGVAFRRGAPYVSTRFEKGGKDAVMQAIRTAAIAFDLEDPAEIEAG